jgi:hypothetical protein
MAKTVKCTRCGRENDASFAFCLDCGQPLRATASAPAVPTCTACGKPLDPGFRFCGHCGHPVAPPAPPPAPPATTIPSNTASAASHLAPPAATAHADVAVQVPPGEAVGPSSGLHLVAVRPDGATAAVHALDRSELVCGRTDGQILVPDDGTVSPRHARFTFDGGLLRVEDAGSVNGTFVRIRAPHRVAVGDEVRMGRQLLRLEPLPRPPAPEEGTVRQWGAPDPGCKLRLAQLLEGGGLGEIFPLKPGETQVGRRPRLSWGPLRLRTPRQAGGQRAGGHAHRPGELERHLREGGGADAAPPGRSDPDRRAAVPGGCLIDRRAIPAELGLGLRAYG